MGDLVWPAVVIFALVYFHRPLVALLKRIKSVKGGGLEVQFDDDAEALEKTTEVLLQGRAAGVSSVTGTLTATVSTDPERSIRLRGMVDSSPRSVVIESWIRVEQQLIRLSSGYVRKPGPRVMLRTMTQVGVIGSDLAGIIDSMLDLRNSVAHDIDEEPGQEGVSAYLNTAIAVVKELESIPYEPPF